MTQRKPGDYVVNAELTDEQRERFVRDCVAAGCEDIGDCCRWRVSTWNLICNPSDHVEGVDESYALRNDVRDVTNEYRKEYKDNPITQPQLMRQIADAVERNPDGWWREFEFWGDGSECWIQCSTSGQVLTMADVPGRLRPKARTYTLHVEDMPEPMREEPRYKQDYWAIELTNMEFRPGKFVWVDSQPDHCRFNRGNCYPDKETAQQAMDKLKAAMGGE